MLDLCARMDLTLIWPSSKTLVAQPKLVQIFTQNTTQDTACPLKANPWSQMTVFLARKWIRTTTIMDMKSLNFVRTPINNLRNAKRKWVEFTTQILPAVTTLNMLFPSWQESRTRELVHPLVWPCSFSLLLFLHLSMPFSCTAKFIGQRSIWPPMIMPYWRKLGLVAVWNELHVIFVQQIQLNKMFKKFSLSMDYLVLVWRWWRGGIGWWLLIRLSPRWRGRRHCISGTSIRCWIWIRIRKLTISWCLLLVRSNPLVIMIILCCSRMGIVWWRGRRRRRVKSLWKYRLVNPTGSL